MCLAIIFYILRDNHLFDKMKKLFKKRIEFYITNVCNLNCDNCNRLNNYYFRGHEQWNDYADIYAQWSEVIDFENICVLGGEPTLHPELDAWLKGLRQLWPKANIDVATNGTRLSYWYKKGFFDLLAENKIELSVNLHNRARYQSTVDEIKSFLINPKETVVVIPSSSAQWVKAYNSVKDTSWPQCETVDDFYKLPEAIKTECTDIHKIDPETFYRTTCSLRLVDERDVKVEIAYYEDFITAPLKYIGDNKFAVYNSDPQRAHDVCWSKGCTHMMKGKIYKCHHMALLPEFAKQFNVEMTISQQNLLASYQPLEVQSDYQTMQDFFTNLPNAMRQCSLCPSTLHHIALQSSTDKPKIKRKIFEINPIN